MPAKKTTSHPFPDKLALYLKVIDTLPDIERKGDAFPYTSLNGHMFSILNKEGKVALKLPKEVLATFLDKYKTTLNEAYGIVQKEYAVVPDDLLANTEELSQYFQASYDHVIGLKPKPTTKSKK